MTNKTYSGNDIKILDDIEHVRIRTPLYLGNPYPVTFSMLDVRSSDFQTTQLTFIPAVYKAVGEIIDNSIDELAQLNQRNKQLVFNATGRNYTVSDNGRGVPIDMHPTGKYTPSIVFGSLRSGRNFENDKQLGVQGMNGVGAAVTNFTSLRYDIEICRDGKIYTQSFHENSGKYSVQHPIIKQTTKKTTGTTVQFELDPAIFTETGAALPDDANELRAHYIALANPGLIVKYNDQTITYKNGFIDYISSRFKSFFQLKIDEDKVKGNVFIIPTEVNFDQPETNVFTWVNSSYLLDGGLFNTQVVNAFTKKVTDHFAASAKRKGGQINTTLVKSSFIVIADLKISDPTFDNQAKTRLTGPDLRKELTQCINDQWPLFVKNSSKWLAQILEHSVSSVKSKEDNEAIKDLEDRIKRRHRAESLIDATSKNRRECRLLATEGDSAKSSISQARDSKTTAAIAMSGKFNNVYDSSPASVLKMGKLTDLLSTIGLVPGKPADRNKLRYGKFVIAVDADYDGQHIFCNYINLFWRFWPELLDPDQPPFVHKLVVPNVVVSKGKQRVHFTTRLEFEAQAHKYKGWDVEYMKGLGSMTMADWKVVLSSPEYEQPVVADEHLEAAIKLMFGPDADARKEWLESENE